MHILRPKKFSVAFMSHLLFVAYIFQSRHLQEYCKRGLSVAWRRHVPTCRPHAKSVQNKLCFIGGTQMQKLRPPYMF